MAKVLITAIAYYLVCGLIFFLSAGRTDLPVAWCYFIVNFAVGVALAIVLQIRNPSLLQERLKPGPGDRDRLFRSVGTLLYMAAILIAGLDVGRCHWSRPISALLQISAVLLTLLGLAILSWAMLANRYFSSAVRLQPDRQQVVETAGPYGFVRHPGYTGGILYFLLSGLALGSWWASVASLPLLPLIVRRTLVEDAMLREGLSGYAEYAEKVRYRLIPGVW